MKILFLLSPHAPHGQTFFSAFIDGRKLKKSQWEKERPLIEKATRERLRQSCSDRSSHDNHQDWSSDLIDHLRTKGFQSEIVSPFDEKDEQKWKKAEALFKAMTVTI